MKHLIPSVTIAIAIAIAMPLAFPAFAGNSSPDPDSTLDKASQAFANEQWQQCIDLLETLHNQGTASAHSFLLLGNAHTLTNQPGPALLAYHRALILKPNLTEARQNKTALERLHLVPRLSTPAWSPPFLWPDNTLIRHILQITAWMIAFLLLWALLFAKTGSRQRRGAIATTILLLLPLTYSIISLWTQNRMLPPPHLTTLLITESPQLAAPTRSAPSIQSGLPPGTPVRIIAKRGEWLYVNAPTANGDSLRGWLHASSTTNLWPWHNSRM